MDTKINTEESNDVLKVLIAAIIEAREVNKNSDTGAREEIASFLKKIEGETTAFFRKHIDRRKEVREKPILSDMAAYYRKSFY